LKTTAALLLETGKLLEMAELEIPALKAGQVLVEIAYSGCCHTQLLEARGYRGPDAWCPHCLGHEGSGVVIDKGSEVSKVGIGDEVVLGWIQASGINAGGAVYEWNGQDVNAGPVTTFSRHAVVSENRLVPKPPSLAMRDAVLLGCAVLTGFGSVLNVCKPQAGQSLAVFGVGGVGLCALVAAVSRRCKNIIAIDVNDGKLEHAGALGATDVINAAQQDALEIILDLTGGGLDFAVEASGRPDAMSQALSAVRPQGGTAVIIGNARAGETLEIDPKQLNMGKRLVGTWGGDADPDRDVPVFADLLSGDGAGLTSLLTEPYKLEDINQALDDLESGAVWRPVIGMAN
jgi:S-(hydroxymethyl)glutathione dehydrogenase/alcohol dehydrogenase